MLFGGVALSGVAVAMWAFLSYLQHKDLLATLRRGSLVLGLIGVFATLGSAPVDDFWHANFGRDSVLFSAPHTFGLFGIFALLGGALLEASPIPGLSRRWLTPLGSAAILAILLVMAFEYDGDVPQFADFWYLPILVTASALAFALSHNVSRDEWIATKAALIYTALMVGVFIFLTVLGLSKPIIPVVIIPALVFDLASRRRLSRPILAGLFTIVWFATYALYLNYVTDGVQLELLDIAAGIPLAFVLSWLTLMLTSTGRPRVSPKILAVLTALLVANLSAQPVMAHDPGQGDEIGQMQFVASVMEGGAVNVAASLPGVEECDLFNPVRITARRAGQNVNGGVIMCHRGGRIAAVAAV